MKKIFLLLVLISITAYGQHTFDNHGLNVGIRTLRPSQALELASGNFLIGDGRLYFGDVNSFPNDVNTNLFLNKGIWMQNDTFPYLRLSLINSNFSFDPFANFALAGHNGYFSYHSRTGDLVIRLGATEQNKMILTNAGGGDIVFATGAWNEYNRIRVSLKPNGFFGIGTQNPDEMLTVKGTIHAQEVKVDLNGACAPDYVFDEDYELMSLKELEDFINKYSHLPEIPAASDLEKEGMNLKKMNLLYLKKIEELTLYILQQKKQIEELQKEIDALKKEIVKPNINQQ